MKYKVGVIGLGSIAAMYGKPDDPRPYCHVGGIRLNERVQLEAVCDLSEEARSSFLATWGESFPDLACYGSMDELFGNHDLDIVAVCVRGPHHFAVTSEVIEQAPKAIFLEKPPSCSLKEMDDMMEAAGRKRIPIMVDYSRHWSPKVLRMQELVANGLIGEVKTIVAWCGGTFLSFASHTTDLICQFAGYCPTEVTAHGRLPENANVPDGFEPEPSLDNMVIQFENGITGIQVGSSGQFGTFYCEAYGDEGFIRTGIYTEVYGSNAKGEAMDLDELQIPEEESVFKVAYEQMASHLDGGPLPHCTNQDFITVNEIGFAGIESVHSGTTIRLPNSNRTRKVFANG
jgi:predicted dehydrogenase